jgi:hypothetical protein
VDMETRLVNFENKRFGEGLKPKSACKTLGFTRYFLQLSTKPNLCHHVRAVWYFLGYVFELFCVYFPNAGVDSYM